MAALLYATAVLADSPKGFWKLNEASGTFADSSGNGNTSTGNAGTVTYSQTSLLPLGGGASIRLDGVYGTYVSLPTSIADWSQAITLDFWYKKNSAPTGSYGNIMGKNQNSSNYALVLYNGGNTGNVLSSSIKPSNTGLTGSTVFSTGVTYHLAMTVTAGVNPVMTWYINGAVEATATVTTARNDSGSFRLGSTPDSFWGCMDGWLQLVAAYDTVLSSTRILAHYNAGLASDDFIQVVG